MTGTVLHISAADAAGGAARSAARIHRGVRALGWRSRMLVGQRRSDDPDVRTLKRSALWRALDRPFSTLTDALSLQYLFLPSSFALVRDPWFRECDVVQLYNVHGSYFSHTALPSITSRRPLVWRLSDMWAMTGHVAYSYDCERWQHGCGSCPYLGEYPRLTRDTTAFLWRWKRRVYARSTLTLVAPSRWMESLARSSPLLRDFDVRRIPNGIDLERFRPRDRGEARHALGLDPAKRVVLFSALEAGDVRKGGAVLADALSRLDDLEFQLVVMGPQASGFPREAHSLGTLHDDERIALAFAAADVYVLPTLAENLPNVALESIACGTPVVAFDVGGVPDAVRDGVSGLLAPLRDGAALAAHIQRLLADDELRTRLGAGARTLAEAEFGAEREARAFAALYEELAASR